MCLQLVSFAILTTAIITLVRFLAEVTVNVLGQFRFHAEPRFAEVALESFHPRVTISVHFQAPGPPVTFATILAFVWPHACKINGIFN